MTCLDCFGNVDGPLVVDACGVCGGSTTDPKDCNKKNVETAVIAGAAVGAAVAVTMAALALFFFLMARKNPNWYIQDVIDKQETTHSHNPLYESQNKEKTNALYEAPRK